VSFADPEDAVRDRLDELSLSAVARDVEDAVREDAVSDANVRETVKRRIEERLDETEDLGAFEVVETDDTPDDGQVVNEGDSTKTADPDPASTDGQVSMEDYL